MGKIIPTHKRNKPVTEFVDNNFALDMKIKEALGSSVLPTTQWAIMEFSNEDKELIADFFIDWSNNEGNGYPMADNTKHAYINALKLLSRYVKEKRNGGLYKPFREMTRDDFFAEYEPKGYLRSLRREFADDPDEKWVGTYNNRFTKYLPFWKWLTQKDIKSEERQTPPQLKGFRYAKYKTKRRTAVKREDLWTPEEHRVFLKYCEDLRIACFHAMHRDVGGRPGELLALKLGDIKIETVPSTGKKRCEFSIGDKLGGKMKRRRPASISDAIPYYNVWAHVHPARDWSDKDKKNAYLFPSQEKKARYRNRPLKENSLRLRYVDIIERDFPKLLTRPEIPLEDKAALRTLIYDKPHFPYVRRHEFATQWAPRTSRSVFNQLMGHSPTSKMQDVYVHELGNEGVLELDIARGVRTREETLTPAQIELQPKYCPICHESNKFSARFCFKCNFTLSVEGALENREKEAQAAREAEETKKKLQQIGDVQEQLTNMQEQMEGLTHAFLVQSLKLHSPWILEQVKDKETKTSTQIVREINKMGVTIVANEPALFTKEERKNGFAERHTLHFEEI
jgi:hypothetical protein